MILSISSRFGVMSVHFSRGVRTYLRKRLNHQLHGVIKLAIINIFISFYNVHKYISIIFKQLYQPVMYVNVRAYVRACVLIPKGKIPATNDGLKLTPDQFNCIELWMICWEA